MVGTINYLPDKDGVVSQFKDLTPFFVLGAAVASLVGQMNVLSGKTKLLDVVLIGRKVVKKDLSETTWQFA